MEREHRSLRSMKEHLRERRVSPGGPAPWPFQLVNHTSAVLGLFMAGPLWKLLQIRCELDLQWLKQPINKIRGLLSVLSRIFVLQSSFWVSTIFQPQWTVVTVIFLKQLSEKQKTILQPNPLTNHKEAV